MAEEYDMRTKQVTRRAWRNKTNIHKDPNLWETELGDDIPTPNSNIFNSIIREASNMPYILKEMEKSSIVWRIRNLSFPLDNYLLSFDNDCK
jgi:hypothetical protein